MTNREKVFDGLRTVVHEMQVEVDEWQDYSDSELRNGLTVDCDWWLDALEKCKAALELLRPKEARILSLDELEEDMVVWLQRSNHVEADVVTIVNIERYKDFIAVKFSEPFAEEESDIPSHGYGDYDYTWCCWSERPTEEQVKQKHKEWDES